MRVAVGPVGVLWLRGGLCTSGRAVPPPLFHLDDAGAAAFNVGSGACFGLPLLIGAASLAFSEDLPFTVVVPSVWCEAINRLLPFLLCAHLSRSHLIKEKHRN